jgi:F-type H+-transporting ATPase subunit epsilon
MAESSDKVLQVELVAADRLVWSGQATMVIARTTEGDVGILPNHAPLLSLLTDGVVEIAPVDGDRMYAAVDGGFLSVANNRVSILAQFAALSHEINVEEARAELEAAQSDSEADDGGARVKRAEARIRAAEKTA